VHDTIMKGTFTMSKILCIIPTVSEMHKLYSYINLIFYKAFQNVVYL